MKPTNLKQMKHKKTFLADFICIKKLSGLILFGQTVCMWQNIQPLINEGFLTDKFFLNITKLFSF